MTFRNQWLSALLAVTLHGCGTTETAAVTGAQARLTGTVTYRERLALPSDAIVEVRLEDVSRADAPAEVLAEQEAAAAGRQVPIPFELSYAAARVQPNRRYVVRASIRTAAGNLMFTTSSPPAVLAGGAPAGSVTVLLQRVGDGGAPSARALPGGVWRLSAIRRPGAADEGVSGEARYTVEFAAGRMSGQAHCNRYTGAYEQSEPGLLTVKPMAATLAACPPPSLAPEFLRALGMATRYELGAGSLRVSFGDGGLLTFVPDTPTGAGQSTGPWADAASRGVRFRALGNEPSWVIEIGAERLTVITQLGARRTELAFRVSTDGSRSTYRATGDGHDLTAVVERTPCADTMSGEALEATATVTLDGATLKGCGRYL